METGPDPAAPPMNLNCGAASAAPAEPPEPAAEAAQPLKKERRIVSWSPEEDELLREQIALHGTENWTSIAARFKDKTSRQCRRRWYTYLNSEAKKGGWSVEEDMLLCEAQKIFGNRWTEIAKVVSGRTDNAVKNRFSTLCKKRVKLEASTKENIRPLDNPSNKRVLVQSSCTTPMTMEMPATNKQTRYYFSESDENAGCHKHRVQGEKKLKENCKRRPLSVLCQNLNRFGKPESSISKSSRDASGGNQGTFLKKGDPKLTALLQQAELLSSLSAKVNADNTEQSLEDAWKELQDFLIQTEESGPLPDDLSGMNLLDQLKEMLEDLKPSNTGEEQPLRQLDPNEDPQGSSKYNSKPNHDVESRNYQQTKNSMRSQDEVIDLDEAPCAPVNACSEEVFLSTGNAEDDVNSFSIANPDLTSPLQTILPFHSFEDEIPSPAFTSSERKFLLSVLNQSSPVNNTNTCKQPSCKRVLMDTLGPS